jgi:hypothetical protein
VHSSAYHRSASEIDRLPTDAIPPGGGLSASEITQITTLARNSAIRKYNWEARGIAPPGYIKGVAVAYGCATRKFYTGHAAFKEIAKANTHNADKDALSWYAGTFDAAGMSNNASSVSTLRHVYVFLMGLGMRESSGSYCAGRDRDMSYTNTTSLTCEAGAWQTSWNAKSCSPTILQGLFDEYKKGAEGYQSIFKEGVHCSANSWENYGSGDGLTFQKMSKEQPVFACEVAAIVIRNLRKHYSSINSRQVEIRKEANDLLKQVESSISA